MKATLTDEEACDAAWEAYSEDSYERKLELSDNRRYVPMQEGFEIGFQAGLTHARNQHMKFPNGWAQPTFMSIDDDSCLYIEWCFGSQGAADSWRVLFCWDPNEGAMVCVTTRDEQECAESGREVTALLSKALDQTKEKL